MKEYPNFYENIMEAKARLHKTLVLYDGEPYTVIAITDHKDEIFRMWLEPLGLERTPIVKQIFTTAIHHEGYPNLDEELEALLIKEPECGVLKKPINSPLFNRFRPFPLGMCNFGTQVYYVERQPIRPSMQQGLTKGACYETLITAGSRQDNPKRLAESLDIYSKDFKECIKAIYYSHSDALEILLDPFVVNDALAFHREFALVRGPLDMIFLAYRSDIIGILPNNDFDFVRLGKEFKYCKEVVEELGVFHKII